MDESGTDGADCNRKVASGRRVVGVIRALVNVRDLQLEDERDRIAKREHVGECAGRPRKRCYDTVEHC